MLVKTYPGKKWNAWWFVLTVSQRVSSMTLHVHDPFFNIDTLEAFAYYTE